MPTQLIQFFDGRIGADGHGILDHSRLGTLHLTNLGSLFFDRKVAVQNSDTTLAGHRNRHARLGHRIHRRRKQRNTQADLLRQLSRCINLRGNNIGQLGKKQNVIVGQSGQSKRISVNVCHERSLGLLKPQSILPSTEIPRGVAKLTNNEPNYSASCLRAKAKQGVFPTCGSSSIWATW